MIYTYKNYKAEIKVVAEFDDFMFGCGGSVYLKSDLINCKSTPMSFDGSESIVLEIYKKYFEHAVDKIAL
jgi:hypothetical protein